MPRLATTTVTVPCPIEAPLFLATWPIFHLETWPPRHFHWQDNLHLPSAYLSEFRGIKERANVNSVLYRRRLDMILRGCAVRLLEFELRMKQ